ncbi:MAG: ATP-grasp domain-containing protein [Clostridia bacterium]|nr:ATP-grasp domain-containing protein [Clostridia bacterium]
MYEQLKGKRLLVIGSAEIDANIVNAAHEMGIYVIVADGVKKSTATFAKNLADEAWDIDYRDTETVAQKCRENGVDGVLAGYSEFRVAAACRIANCIGCPFYATLDQIELTRNKRRFKDTCRKYGVQVPTDYRSEDMDKAEYLAGVRFPVIVKPTDAAGRKGITICQEASQLGKAIALARSQSVTGTIVIEEYVKGIEFVAVYTLQDGHSSLSCFNEKYLDKESTSGLCDLALAPSSYLDQYIGSCDQPVRAFLKGIRAENGVAFFQGIVTQDRVVVFEMGYRLNGGNDYFIADKENGINYMKMLISHSLTGKMEGDLDLDKPRFGRYYANFLLYAHAGTVGRVKFHGTMDKEGLEDIHIKKVAGMTVKDDGSTQQCAFTFKLSADSRQGIIDLIHYCQANAEMTDEHGNNMLFSPFDASVLNT